MSISSSPIAAHFYAGLRLNLTCYIELTPPSPLDEGASIVRLSSTWEKSGTILVPNEHLLIDEGVVLLDELHYKTSLVILALDGSGRDDGEYTCSVNVSSNNDLVVGASAMSLKNIFVEGMVKVIYIY